MYKLCTTKKQPFSQIHGIHFESTIYKNPFLLKKYLKYKKLKNKLTN